MKACFMFGHRDCPESIMPNLIGAITNHYEQHNISAFYVGNRGRFDSLAASAVRQVKQRYPEIQLYLLLAYHPGEKVPDTYGFDGSYYPPLENVPRPYAIVRGNRHMAENADAIICYISHLGNTRNLLDYIKKKNRAFQYIILRKRRNKDDSRIDVIELNPVSFRGCTAAVGIRSRLGITDCHEATPLAMTTLT